MRGIYQNAKDKVTLARWKRCVSTFHRVLEEKHFTPPEIRTQCLDVQFVCVPRFETLKEVYDYNRRVEKEKANNAIVGETLFKIPSLVNDVEGYVTMLLNKHYDRK